MNKFTKFQPYSISSKESSENTSNSIIPTSIPALFNQNGQEEWVLDFTDEFSQETEIIKQAVPYFNPVSYFFNWLLTKWKYFVFAIVFLAFPLFSSNLLNWLVNSAISNWFTLILKNSLEYQPIQGISIFSGIFYIFLTVELIIFLAKEIVSFPHKLQERLADNRCQAKQALQERIRTLREEKFKDYQLHLDELKKRQELIHQAQEILANQIALDKESKIILTERLGSANIPREDKFLGELVLKTLSECYLRKKNNVSNKNH